MEVRREKWNPKENNGGKKKQDDLASGESVFF